MPTLLTHYYFAEECIKSLDEKYKSTFNYSNRRLYLYSNIFNLPKYYKLNQIFAKQNDEYELTKRLDDKKRVQFIKTAINHLQRNGYDKDNVLFLYGIVCHHVLDKFLQQYINNIVNNNDELDHLTISKAIDEILFKNKEKTSLYNENLYKRFKGAYIYTFANLEIINLALKENNRFSKPEEFFKESLKSLKHFSSPMVKPVLPFYKFADKLAKKDPQQQRISYLYNKTYPNIDFMNKDLKFGDQTFEDMYNEAIDTCSMHLEAVNKFLFYKNDKDFKKLFNME